MPDNGLTIYSLNSVSAITANDETPVWDAEAAPNEPTKKITGSNLAASIKTLGSLLGTSDVVDNLTSTATDKPLAAAQGKALSEAIAQSTAKVVEAIVNTSDLTFEARSNWYRANVNMKNVFGRTDIDFVQTVTWSGTNVPIITQLDGYNVQFISPNKPSNGSVTVRGIIL